MCEDSAASAACNTSADFNIGADADKVTGAAAAPGRKVTRIGAGAAAAAAGRVTEAGRTVTEAGRTQEESPRACKAGRTVTEAGKVTGAAGQPRTAASSDEISRLGGEETQFIDDLQSHR